MFARYVMYHHKYDYWSLMLFVSIWQFDNLIDEYISIIHKKNTVKMKNGNKQHQWSIVILMMIHYIPCKQTLLCHVVNESNLYFSDTTVVLHCINAVLTRVVCSRPFRLINSFDHHGFLHILFVVKIIWLPLSAFLWSMQIHVQDGSKQWAQ